MIHVDETDPVGEVEPSFPYRDVTIKRGVEAKEFYELESEIGRGKFGTVYRCREKATGLTLAAKFVNTPRKEDRRNVEREVDIMRSLQHPRLIQLYDAFDNGKVICVVLELIEGGELFERVIDDDFVLTEKSCTVFMRQICEGIEFIHKQNILHLDMKPENILCLTKTGNRIKIIDFGLARKYDPNKKLQVLFGTPEFVAPEVVNFDQIGYGTDMWSVGVICYVLLSGLSPFMGETDIETMANVTVAKYDFDDEAFNEISPEAKDFITKLLVKNKEDRMSARQALEHAWLKRTTVLRPALTIPSGLEMTKDNLRSFVERWGEHPNSPYLFDVNTHLIVPCPNLDVDLRTSTHSLRGMSPSPCGSVETSPDFIIEHDDTLAPTFDDRSTFEFGTSPPQKTNNFSPHKICFDHLQTFERRASDSSCIVKKNDVSERVNLAEEIKKLSDKLFRMATMSTELTIRSDSNSTSDSSDSGVFNSPPILNINDTAASYDVNTNSNCLLKREEFSEKRTKYRMTSLNRDVPVINNNSKSVLFTEDFVSRGRSPSTDSNQSVSSASSNNSSQIIKQTATKDLLLHLLDKWDDAQTVNVQSSAADSRRHKSVSVEWTETNESLEQRTISSLNTFFQSRQSVKKTHPFFSANGVK